MSTAVNLNNLLGTAEIAELAGVNRSTVNQWAIRHRDFPRPVFHCADRKLYDRHEVLDWLEGTGRI